MSARSLMKTKTPTNGKRKTVSLYPCHGNGLAFVMRNPDPYEESLRNIARLYDALYELERNFYRIPNGPKRIDIAISIQAAGETAQMVASEMRVRVDAPPLGDDE